jgi:hypothetical protein
VHYRLAKLIEKRKGHKESVRQQHAEDLEREETAIGRRIENSNVGEMVAWNKAYDGKHVSVTTGLTSVESIGKTSENRFSSAQDLTMSQLSLDGEKKSSRGYRNATEANTELHGNTKEIQETQDMAGERNAVDKDRPISKRSVLDENPQSNSRRKSVQTTAPEVIPLPFKIPGVQTEIPASAPGSMSAIEDLLSPGRLNSQRNSVMSSTWKRDSIRNTLHEENHSAEDMCSNADDGASSLAATLDEREEDEMSLSEVSAPRSPVQEKFSNKSLNESSTPAESPSIYPSEAGTSLDQVGDLVPVGPTPAIPEKSAKRNSMSDLREDMINIDNQRITSSTPSVHGLPEDALSEKAHTQEKSGSLAPTAGDDAGAAEALSFDNKGKANAIPDRNEARRSMKSLASNGPPVPGSDAIVSLKALLPAGPSKTERIYRTNEWSKHQDPEAEAPNQDIIEEPPSPGVRVDTSFKEAAAQEPPISPVVDPDQFVLPGRNSKRISSNQQAPEIQRPKTASTSRNKRSSLNSLQTSRPPSGSPTPNNQSTATLGGTSYNDPQHSSGGNSRNSSTPQLQTLENSAETPPISRPATARPTSRMGTPKQVGSVPQSRSTDTLIGKRESLVKSRQSSLAFAQSSTALAQNSSDDIPLSQHRKSLLQSPPRPTSHRQDTWPAPAHYSPAQSALNLTNLNNFDSHQPKRSSNTVTQDQRADRLTSWREGLREERPTNSKRHSGHRKTSQPSEDATRQSLLQAKRQQEQAIEREKLKKQFRDQAIENAMRSGALIDAHNRKLKDMQGGSGAQ